MDALNDFFFFFKFKQDSVSLLTLEMWFYTFGGDLQQTSHHGDNSFLTHKQSYTLGKREETLSSSKISDRLFGHSLKAIKVKIMFQNVHFVV